MAYPPLPSAELPEANIESNPKSNRMTVLLYYLTLFLNLLGHCAIWFVPNLTIQWSILLPIMAIDLAIYLGYVIYYFVESTDSSLDFVANPFHPFEKSLIGMILQYCYENVHYQGIVQAFSRTTNTTLGISRAVGKSYSLRVSDLLVTKLVASYLMSFGVHPGFYLFISVLLFVWNSMGLLLSLIVLIGYLVINPTMVVPF